MWNIWAYSKKEYPKNKTLKFLYQGNPIYISKLRINSIRLGQILEHVEGTGKIFPEYDLIHEFLNTVHETIPNRCKNLKYNTYHKILHLIYKKVYFTYINTQNTLVSIETPINGN